MSVHYYSHDTEIIDEPFESGSVRFNKTVLIRSYGKNHKLIHSERYGYAETEELYRILNETGELNLNNTYIQNFSLSEYRIKYQPDKQGVLINNFSAINTFFDSEDVTDFSHAEFDGISADFINSHFATGKINFYKTRFRDIDVDFSNVYFGNENVNFQFTEFGKGNISFENAVFGEGDISFVNTEFGDGKVNFRNTDFGNGDVDFHFSHFGKGDISFDKARFNGHRLDFRRVDFGDGKLEFTRTYFGDGEINFEESEGGPGRKNFRRAIFGDARISFERSMYQEELNFENAEFGFGKLSFFNATLNGISLKNCLLNNYIDLRVNECPMVDLSNTIIKDIIDLKPGFSLVKLKELNLSGARNLGKIFLNWKENDVYHLITRQANTSLLEKAEQFRILKEDFNSSGQYLDEDLAYVEFKRFELKHSKEKALKEQPKKKWVTWISYWLQVIVFDKMGLYATSPVRVIFSMFTVYFIFTCIYMLLPHISDSQIMTGLTDPEPLSSFAVSMYYSAITFFTIGYGDYFPYGPLRWVACVEGFAGVFMMSYFVVAFVRKMLR